MIISFFIVILKIAGSWGWAITLCDVLSTRMHTCQYDVCIVSLHIRLCKLHFFTAQSSPVCFSHVYGFLEHNAAYRQSMKVVLHAQLARQLVPLKHVRPLYIISEIWEKKPYPCSNALSSMCSNSIERAVAVDISDPIVNSYGCLVDSVWGWHTHTGNTQWTSTSWYLVSILYLYIPESFSTGNLVMLCLNC